MFIRKLIFLKHIKTCQASKAQSRTNNEFDLFNNDCDAKKVASYKI